MGGQIFRQDPTSCSFEYTPRSRIAESHVSSFFNFLRKLHTVFRSSCTVLHFLYATVHKVSNFSTFFLMIVILTGINRYIIVVFICIFLMISNVEHLFTCLFTICISPLEKWLFQSAYFLNQIICLSVIEL